MFKKLITNKAAQKQADRQATLYSNLIRREAEIGGQLFGPIPKGHRREFFCLDAHTWVWHEEWTDEDGQYHVRTTRYDVRPDGILKAQDGQHYQHVSVDEANRLNEAAQLYQQRIKSQLYRVSQ
jgi:hypothetical protein